MGKTADRGRRLLGAQDGVGAAAELLGALGPEVEWGQGSERQLAGRRLVGRDVVVALHVVGHGSTSWARSRSRILARARDKRWRVASGLMPRIRAASAGSKPETLQSSKTSR